MLKFIPWFRRSTRLSDSKPVEAGLTPGGDENQSNGVGSEHLSTQRVSKPSGSKPFYRRYWFWLGLGVSGGVITLGYSWWSLERSLPETSELFTFVRDNTLTIKAADSTILQQQGPATRQQLKLEEMPKPLIQAFIASEDRRFYQHHGVDYQGILRAFVSNIHAGNVVEGGSTITQQLARILFLDQERSLWRKLREVSLSQKIEQKLSKDQILERYLNLVYLGQGAYGVADAAWVYFSKPVKKLTLPEMATLAGLAPAPSRYSPAANIEVAQQRRNIVLQRMQEDGAITAKEAAVASTAALTLQPSLPKRLRVEAPYFTTYIQQQLPKYVSPEVLEAGGLTVETSLNRQWQKAAETAVKDAIVNNSQWQHFEQAAMVAVDPRNGEVRAMVGGKDFSKNQFNRVTQAQRQPGSTFKGFVYAAAIATGKSPYNVYEDAPFVVSGYEPKNFSQRYLGWINLRDALANSVNVVAVKVLIEVGFKPTLQLAHLMGIKSPLQSTYSLALGSSEVNLLELTSAYGTLATQGVHTEVHGIRRVLDRRGQVLWKAAYKPKRVLDKGSAAISTWMLQNVVEAGTGAPARLDRPVAGKTGTSDKSRDLWFIGYIPQLVTGVWLGNDNNEPTWGSSGTAAATWHQFMAKAVAGMPTQKFPELPKLEGRKGSIKAQPIKPKQVFSGSINPVPNGNSVPNIYQPYGRRYGRTYQQQDNTSTRRRYRRRYRVNRPQQSNQQPTQQQPNWQQKLAPDALPAAPNPPATPWQEKLRSVEPPPSTQSTPAN